MVNPKCALNFLSFTASKYYNKKIINCKEQCLKNFIYLGGQRDNNNLLPPFPYQHIYIFSITDEVTNSFPHNWGKMCTNNIIINLSLWHLSMNNCWIFKQLLITGLLIGQIWRNNRKTFKLNVSTPQSCSC